jgi:hypothetical protein
MIQKQKTLIGYGSSGRAVVRLQSILVELGLLKTITGLYDEETVNAVKQFQLESASLGAVDETTWEDLESRSRDKETSWTYENEKTGQKYSLEEAYQLKVPQVNCISRKGWVPSIIVLSPTLAPEEDATIQGLVMLGVLSTHFYVGYEHVGIGTSLASACAFHYLSKYNVDLKEPYLNLKMIHILIENQGGLKNRIDPSKEPTPGVFYHSDAGTLYPQNCPPPNPDSSGRYSAIASTNIQQRQHLSAIIGRLKAEYPIQQIVYLKDIIDSKSELYTVLPDDLFIKELQQVETDTNE